MAGFLPTLAELGEDPPEGLHTLYVSPLKALAADIKRNLRTRWKRSGCRSGSTTAPAIPPPAARNASAPTRRISC